MPQFQTFNRHLPRLKDPLRVTLLRSAMLSLNRAAYVALGSPGTVELLYDARAHIVGMRPVEPTLGSAYIVRRPSHSPSGPFLITALAFTKYYDIDTSQSLRWDASLDHGVLCVCLTDVSTPVTSNRAGSARADVSTVVPLPAGRGAPRRRIALPGTA